MYFDEMFYVYRRILINRSITKEFNLNMCETQNQRKLADATNKNEKIKVFRTSKKTRRVREEHYGRRHPAKRRRRRRPPRRFIEDATDGLSMTAAGAEWP
uniref:Uncharacterized protein n=1 Tax=Arion vulgaris TaxID=1028688 RepID=A0A0B7AK66_9EUPU